MIQTVALIPHLCKSLAPRRWKESMPIRDMQQQSIPFHKVFHHPSTGWFLLLVKSHQTSMIPACPTHLSFSYLPQAHLANSVRFSWKERTRSSLPSWPLLKYTHFKRPPQSPRANTNSSPAVVFSAVKPSIPIALCWKSRRPPLVLLCMNIPDHFLALEEASCHSIDPAGDFKPMCSPFFWLTVKARSCLSRSPGIHKALLLPFVWLTMVTVGLENTG